MVKLIFLCQRKAELSHAEYVERLLEGHVPLALRHHPTMTKYVVNIVEDSPPGELPLDSIGELSFATLDDYRARLFDSPEGQRVIAADVAGFLGAASAYATTERVQKAATSSVPLGQRTPGVKLYCPLTRRAGMSHVQFVDHWLTRHVPLALRHHPGLTRYVNNVVDQSLSPDAPAWDGFAELHLATSGDWHNGLFDSPAGERIVRDDIVRFIGRTGAYRVAEYIQKQPDR
jgi:uncharacterized protein (TIGR02118 family)